LPASSPQSTLSLASLRESSAGDCGTRGVHLSEQRDTAVSEEPSKCGCVSATLDSCFHCFAAEGIPSGTSNAPVLIKEHTTRHQAHSSSVHGVMTTRRRCCWDVTATSLGALVSILVLELSAAVEVSDEPAKMSAGHTQHARTHHTHTRMHMHMLPANWSDSKGTSPVILVRLFPSAAEAANGKETQNERVNLLVCRPAGNSVRLVPCDCAAPRLRTFLRQHDGANTRSMCASTTPRLTRVRVLRVLKNTQHGILPASRLHRTLNTGASGRGAGHTPVDCTGVDNTSWGCLVPLV
jgi:hypothetical protein